jgi:endonuclease-3
VTAARKPPRSTLPKRAEPDRVLERLVQALPNPRCELAHEDAWQLLIATILSAQSTDARVNMVTPALFGRFPSPAALAAAELPVVEELVRSTGFYRNKA